MNFKIIVLFIASLYLNTIIKAQGGKSNLAALNLTAQQKMQIKNARLQAKTEADEINAKNISDAEKQAALKALKIKQSENLKNILTADQVETFLKAKNGDNKTFRANKNKGSDSSQIKIGNIKEKMKAQKEAIIALKNDTTLTQKQKSKKAKAIKAQNEAFLKANYTPAQIEKMKALKGKKGEVVNINLNKNATEKREVIKVNE